MMGKHIKIGPVALAVNRSGMTAGIRGGAGRLTRGGLGDGGVGVGGRWNRAGGPVELLSEDPPEGRHASDGV